MSLAIIPRRGHIGYDVQRNGRPVLYLVPALGELAEPEGSGPAVDRALRKRQGHRPVRLTRRGRIVIGLFLLSLVIAVASIT